MKLLIIAATHGNELLGTKFYAYLLKTRSPLLEHIDFIIGNPRALAANVRYVESDLNRSYSLGTDTYEQRRANEIAAYIRTNRPDLVIDMHTTSTKQPDIIIVGNTTNKDVRRFLAATHIPTVLQVTSMHDSASITPNLVAYEIPNRNINTILFKRIEADLLRHIARTSLTLDRYIYTMTDKIYKKDVPAGAAKTFINFKMHELGFVPIMTGNNSYKKQTDYLGFKSGSPAKLHL